ncbi:MAG: CehA/McbA family metallohydrolase [Victivallaceae bacterium]|nr:CehA/McbA family metallohydrolase [Victivallaceae bacterium]
MSGVVGLAALSVAGGETERFAKCELHMHTTRSDGNATPKNAAKIYNDKNFNVCIFTDHIVDWCYGGWFNPKDMLNDRELNDFISMPGSELSVALLNRYGRPIEVHINALGIKYPMMPAYTGDIVSEIRENVRRSWDAGAVAQVNHPNFLWSFDYRELLQIDEPYLFELVNADPGCNNYGDLSRPGAEQIWDVLLSNGKRVYGTATDDTHYYYNYQPAASSPGYGWVVCSVSELTPEAVLNALRLGKFYASTGPELEAYEVDGRTIRVKVKPQDRQHFRIKFIGRYGRLLHEVEGLEAEYTIKGDEYYVRARVGDDAESTSSASGIPGQALYCQPVFVADIEAREAFLPKIADFSERAKKSVMALKFGGAADGFVSVNPGAAADGAAKWRSSGALTAGSALLPGLTPVENGYVFGEHAGTLEFSLPAGSYRATLLTGESGSRIAQPSSLQVELNGRPVLSGIMEKSGEFALNSFEFATDGAPQKLTFRGIPRMAGDYCRPEWSATALIFEKTAGAKLPEVAALFDRAPDVEMTRNQLEMSVPEVFTLNAVNASARPETLTLTLTADEKMKDYFSIEPLDAASSEVAQGVEFSARFRVMLRKPFDLKKKMQSTIVGDEWVPEPPDGVFFAGVSVAGAAEKLARFRVPLTEAKLKVRSLDRDNRFAVIIEPGSEREMTGRLNVDVPSGWRLAEQLPETVTAKDGMPVVVEMDFVPTADGMAAGDTDAKIEFSFGNATVAAGFPLRRNGEIGKFQGPGTFEVPFRVTRGLTVVCAMEFKDFTAMNVPLMFREQKYSEFMIYTKPDGSLHCKIEDSIDNYHDRVEFSGPVLEAGRKYTVAVAWDKWRGGAMYVDGVKVADFFGDINVVDLIDNGAPLVLGSGTGAAVMYNYALTDKEIADISATIK